MSWPTGLNQLIAEMISKPYKIILSATVTAVIATISQLLVHFLQLPYMLLTYSYLLLLLVYSRLVPRFGGATVEVSRSACVLLRHSARLCAS